MTGRSDFDGFQVRTLRAGDLEVRFRGCHLPLGEVGTNMKLRQVALFSKITGGVVDHEIGSVRVEAEGFYGGEELTNLARQQAAFDQYGT